MMVTEDQQLDRCQRNRNTWLEDSDSENQLQHSQTVLSLPTINMALQRVQNLATTVEEVNHLSLACPFIANVHSFPKFPKFQNSGRCFSDRFFALGRWGAFSARPRIELHGDGKTNWIT